MIQAGDIKILVVVMEEFNVIRASVDMDAEHKSRTKTALENKKSHTFHAIGKCRICLSTGHIPIFGMNSIAKEIKQVADINILESDNLPKYLCDNCYALLQSALLFINTAQNTDLILRSNKDYFGSDENESVCSEILGNLECIEPFVKCEYLVVDEGTEESDIESDWNNVTSQSHNDNAKVVQCENEEYLVEYLDFEEADDIKLKSKINTSMQDQIIEKEKSNNYTFSNAEELKHEKGLENQITCEICNEFIDKEFYNIHIKFHRAAYKKKVQKNREKVKCDICNKMINKNYYNYHKKLLHGNENEKADTISKCPICNEIFSARNLTEHIKRSHYNSLRDDQIYKQCPVCDRNIKEEKYKQHLANHGNPHKDYICDKCGRKCTTKSSFNTHRLTHGSELKYKCDFCPYRGSHLGLLKIHVRTHTKDYNYKCTICEAKFINKSNLSIHMQRHSGVGKHKCEYCEKTFYQKRNKENHIKTIHSTERNHKCDMCGAMFAHRDGMLSHQIKTHKREKLVNHIGRLPTYLKNELDNSNK